MPYFSQYLPFYLSAPPSVLTEPAKGISAKKATLHGTVNPNSLPTDYWFQYAPVPGAWTTIPVLKNAEAGEGAKAVAVSINISGLEPATEYQFRVLASNSEGVSTGEILTFTTLAAPKAVRRRKPPLDLDVEVETPAGFKRLTSDSKNAGDRPRGMSFGTQRGDGFTTATLSLSRPILKDFPDINLMDTWRFVGHQGDIAYEGRLYTNPRSNDPEEQLNIQLVGWMTYLKSKKISPLIIDRRLSSWVQPSLQRRIFLSEHLFDLTKANASPGFVDSGPARAGMVFTFTDLEESYGSLRCEFYFYGGGEDLGEFDYDYLVVTPPPEGSAISGNAFLCKDDSSEEVAEGEAHFESAANQSISTGSAGMKFARMSISKSGPYVGTSNAAAFAFVDPRVRGRHGLTRHSEGGGPDGFYLTDIMKYVLSTFYPKIKWAGENNDFIVTQATWHDNPQPGYQIVQELNNLALWETSVWENRTFHFEPADLTKYDWIIRTDDPGVSVVFQGDTIENFANGITVAYTDFTGLTRTITPDDNAELKDTSPNNPANIHEEDLWTDTEVPWPCFEDEAVQFAKAKLVEFNRPKRAGTYRIKGGYIKDGAGVWQQGWKPRASQTLGIEDHPADEPRLIVATEWDHDNLELTITVDGLPDVLDAYVARHDLERTGANL